MLRLGILSDDGKAKVFDESADGYVRSEMTGAIFMQKAKDCRRVYAKVKFFFKLNLTFSLRIESILVCLKLVRRQTLCSRSKYVILCVAAKG